MQVATYRGIIPRGFAFWLNTVIVSELRNGRGILEGGGF